ncbi:MAG: hypothetical protein HC769_32560 [Cyanobacteria bacterium CRU_2_1]|nr:hypothetical protein [Cyanobacteria bacterium CRU_2_1]
MDVADAWLEKEIKPIRYIRLNKKAIVFWSDRLPPLNSEFKLDYLLLSFSESASIALTAFMIRSTNSLLEP